MRQPIVRIVAVSLASWACAPARDTDTGCVGDDCPAPPCEAVDCDGRDDVPSCSLLPLECGADAPVLGVAGQVVSQRWTASYTESGTSADWVCADFAWTVPDDAHGYQLEWSPERDGAVVGVAFEGRSVFHYDLPAAASDTERDIVREDVTQAIGEADPSPWRDFTRNTLRMQFPSSSASLPQAGCLAMRMAWPVHADHEAAVDVTTNRSDGNERLDVHVAIPDGVDLTPEQALDVLTLADQYLQAHADVQVGDVTFETLDARYAYLDASDLSAIEDLFAASMGDPEHPYSLPLVFVQNTVGFVGLLGQAGGIPGPPYGDGGTRGLFISVEPHHGPNGLDYPFMASTLSHEIGHYNGLLHTSESCDGNDGFTDTPACIAQCPDITLADDCPDGRNLMFWQSSGVLLQDLALSSHQARTLRSLTAYPARACDTHDACDAHEICDAGACATAYGRPYTLFMDAAQVDGAPVGGWDPGEGAPDPYIRWEHGVVFGYSSYVVDSWAPVYDETTSFVPWASLPWTVGLYDDDGAVDELIDEWASPVMPASTLRQPTLRLEGTRSQVDIGFQAVPR